MSLTGKQVEAIAEALIDAYDISSLRRMIRTRLNLRLDTITLGDNFTIIIDDLIDWAEREGYVQELIQEAHADNSSNGKLAKLYGDSQNWTFPKPSPNRYSAPMMALAPPDDFVKRPAEYNQLIDHLLSDNNQPVAITATIRGAGGFGKTTLAQALCHDERTRDAFPDGILWTTVGDDRANVLQGVRKLYQALTGKEAQFVDEHDATTQICSVLADLRCLIVIDDVWNAVHLKPFLEGGENCARLVTTRIATVVPKGAHVVSLDAMDDDEATELLWAKSNASDKKTVRNLARRLGKWPLLLKLVNRRLYEDVTFFNIELTDAVAKANKELDEGGLMSFDMDDAEEREQAVSLCYAVSIKRLKTDQAERFMELAIFPKDTSITLVTLARYWQQTGELSEYDTERLCRRLAELGLVLHYDIQTGSILLHDVTLDYLVGHASNSYHALQNALLNSCQAVCDGEWWQLPDDGYIYQNLLWHMHEARQQKELEALLQTYRWIDTKLQTTNIVSLIRDFDLRRNKELRSQLGLLQHALQISIGVLARDKEQLPSQLYGRINGLGKYWGSFAHEIANQKRIRWLQPSSPSLTRPGGNLLYTFSEHTEKVSNLLLTPDGRLISSCENKYDCSIKVWDVDKGGLLHSLEGHTDGICRLLLTADGRLISSCSSGYSSSDCSVKVWDIEEGVMLHSLEGHTDGVSNLLPTADGRLISSSGGITSSKDTSVKVWDIEEGILIHSLEGHTDGVSNLLLTPDNRLVSCCGSGYGNSDSSVKVWDIEKVVLLHSLEGHTDAVSNLLLTATGLLISSCRSNNDSSDSSIKVWNIEKGVLLHSLEGHTDGVSNLLLTATGLLISSCRSNNDSSDSSVKVWDIEKGALLHSLEGHTDGVSNLLLTATGLLISSCRSNNDSSDSSIKVWDIEKGALLHSLEGHTDGADNLLLTSDGRLISSCTTSTSHLSYFSDPSIKVWDIEEGVLLHSLEGHTDGVDKLQLTPDGRLISCCRYSDPSIKVWDIEQGAMLRSLEGHTDIVSHLLLTSDSRLISSGGGRDPSIKVWDIEERVRICSEERHTVGVSDLLLTSDRQLISYASDIISDPSMKIWDISKGVLLRSLKANANGIDNLLLTPNGRLISSCTSIKSVDPSVKVWDLAEGVILHSLEGHTAGVSNLLLTPDGRLITSCTRSYSSSDLSIKVWDIEEGVLLHSLEGHTDDVSNLLLAPNGRLISSSRDIPSMDMSIKVWDIEKGVMLHSLEGHTAGVSNLLLTSDGRLISSCGSGDPNVKVWDTEEGMLLHSLEGHTGGVRSVLITPDGLLISSCTGAKVADPSVKVWDIGEGALLHSLEGHTAGVSNLILTPDGRLISSCHGSNEIDASVKVWDIEEGILLHSLEGHTAGVSNLILTPDGRLISSCNYGFGRDSSVKVWDIEGGVLLHSLDKHVLPVKFMALSLVSHRFITSGGNQLIIWNWESGEQVAQFTADGAILSCMEADDGRIVVGDALGNVHFLKLIEP
ncbi:MAG: NB-ARC domain-containing protein [Chloroflexota bacterium]